MKNVKSETFILQYRTYEGSYIYMDNNTPLWAYVAKKLYHLTDVMKFGYGLGVLGYSEDIQNINYFYGSDISISKSILTICMVVFFPNDSRFYMNRSQFLSDIYLKANPGYLHTHPFDITKENDYQGHVECIHSNRHTATKIFDHIKFLRELEKYD